MLTKILKFGGSSISYPDSLSSVLNIVRKNLASETRIVVVISAFAGQTDKLMKISQGDTNKPELIEEIKIFHLNFLEQICQIDPELKLVAAPKIERKINDLLTQLSNEEIKNTAESRDTILSYGERFSLEVLGEVFLHHFKEFEVIDSREFIQTNESFGIASIDYPKSLKKIESHFANFGSKNFKNVLTNGFLGKSGSEKITTLGRGGSDYTATFLAYALEASSVEIYTAFDGVMTADPQKVENAYKIPNISYEEAIELCYLGSKVIFPRAIHPVHEKQIPLFIKNFRNPEAFGTKVSQESSPSETSITGLTSSSEITLLRLEGNGTLGNASIVERLFSALAKKEISIKFISQASSECSMCFAVVCSLAEKVEKLINKEFSEEITSHLLNPIVRDDNLSIVSVIGQNMCRTPGISGKVFQVLGKNGINITAIAQGSSELNISVAVSSKDESKALRSLHDAFFLSDLTSIHLYLVGAGNVGRELLHQISINQDSITKRGLSLKLVGIANSKKMYFDEEGVDTKNFKNLIESGEKLELRQYLKKIKELNLPNSIFVDCTSNEEVTSFYEEILDAAVSIVTPNKKANSSDFSYYKKIRATAKKRNVKFYYETNVGAGLPIINTLHDLIITGDKILKIEAVLSGTLSYIFNNFNSSKKFSEIVKEAKEKGYTEPDPRDDLSGTDVARKLLILARELGEKLELKDVKVESLVPEKLQGKLSASEFLEQLPNFDSEFEALIKKAENSNSVLRYIAQVENGEAQVSLQMVDSNHPFYSLSGSDNIISFTTERYLARPLVVKGPGAGNVVTAAGVLSDILRAASYLV